MRRVGQGAVEAALDAVGVRTGHHVLVHAGLLRFGLPEAGVDTYRKAFDRVLGTNGTLAAPTFSFSFVQTGQYHWAETPSEQMGVFAEAIRKDPSAQRTRHPMQSVALIGHHSKDLASIETASVYGPDGVFQAMCDLDFRLLTLGADPGHLSHSHLSEELAQVPYRYEKWVSGRAVLGGGEPPRSRDWLFFARDLDINARPKGEAAVVAELEAEAHWTSATLNAVPIHFGRARDFVDRLSARLAKDSLWMIPESDRTRVEALLEARFAGDETSA